MRTLKLSIMLVISASLYGSSQDDLTETLHAETALLKSSILQEEACPTLYTLIKQITSKANIPMPKSIVITDTEYAIFPKYAPVMNSVTIRTLSSNVYFDFLGDLIITKDIITQFKHNELEGLLSAAAAAKAQSQITKQFAATVGIASVMGTIDLCRQAYNFPTGDSFFKSASLIGTLPLALLYAYVGRAVQRSADISALEITDQANIRDGLYALARLRNNYASSSTTERLFAAFNLENLYKKIVVALSDDNSTNVRLDAIETNNH